jgi:hypothetical protein
MPFYWHAQEPGALYAILLDMETPPDIVLISCKTNAFSPLKSVSVQLKTTDYGLNPATYFLNKEVT